MSYNSNVLNTYKKNQADTAISNINSLIYDLQRTGQLNLMMPFSTIAETLYWTKSSSKGMSDQNFQNNVNGGVERVNLDADYNNDTVSAAAAAGVTLNLSDGVSLAEKDWLYTNLSSYHQMFADKFYYGLGRERIKATSGSLVVLLIRI